MPDLLKFLLAITNTTATNQARLLFQSITISFLAQNSTAVALSYHSTFNNML